MSDGLDILDPSAGSRVVDFGGQRVIVAPMTMRQLPLVARALKGVELPSDASGIVGLIADHGERIYEAVAAATNLEVATIVDSSLPEFVLLASAVLEVNADFFGQAVRSMLAALPSQQASGDGQTPSKP